MILLWYFKFSNEWESWYHLAAHLFERTYDTGVIICQCLLRIRWSWMSLDVCSLYLYTSTFWCVDCPVRTVAYWSRTIDIRSCQYSENVINKYFMNVLSRSLAEPFLSQQDIPSFEASVHQEKTVSSASGSINHNCILQSLVKTSKVWNLSMRLLPRKRFNFLYLCIYKFKVSHEAFVPCQIVDKSIMMQPSKLFLSQEVETHGQWPNRLGYKTGCSLSWHWQWP